MKKLSAVLVLGGLGLAGCSDGGTLPGGEEERVGEAQDALVKYCKFLDPAAVAPLGIPVDFARELVIRDLPVVEDPCRTTWTMGGPCVGSRGVFTFAAAMTQIAGAVPPQQFVSEWLRQWEVGVVVGGRFVPPRPGIRPALIDPWFVASGCPAGTPLLGGGCALDLQKAPFRLLAIVNRVDMSTWTTGAPPTRDPEARLVFGAFDAITGNPIPATVIFEYKLPNQRGGVPYTTLDWANAWHALSNPALGPIGSSAYLGALTPLVQDITFAGAQPGNPNFGSALGQVRTNEIAFGGAPWKLREFHLINTGAGFNAERLRMAFTKQTPDDTLNVTPATLDPYLEANSMFMGSPALMNFTHTVPPGLLGAESSAPLLWNHSGASPLTPLERTQFGFGTCNGCHTLETSTAFTHIAPRAAGAVAALSPFLSTPTASAGGLPTATLVIADPAPTGATFNYNETWRRVCETTAILDGAPGPVTNGNDG